MKHENELRKLLGITQQDMAMLLGVGREHYAMFELGRRSLPSGAMLLLAELLSHGNTKRAAALKMAKKELVQQDEEKVKLLQGMLFKNRYQAAKLERKIAALRKKIEAQRERLFLVDFLKGKLAKGVGDEKMRAVLASVANSKTAVGEKEFLTLEVRREVLEMEAKVLERKIAEIN